MDVDVVWTYCGPTASRGWDRIQGIRDRGEKTGVSKDDRGMKDLFQEVAMRRSERAENL